ncbi:MAG: ParB/RepB/Spo0J family partition protein [Hyphomicrobiales bacterium]|nr:ParB/RepB/Spo0J family partition protein [Hyphomicrobiales bacterium]
MDLMHIPLRELSIAKTNVRHGVKKVDLNDIIPSIRKRGILQPLLVRKNGKGHEVVAGKRRYLALNFLEKEGVEIEAVPCAVMAKGDDAAAVEASLIENVARLPMDDMDQFEAFQRLLKEGRTIEEIADTFGVTTITVKRRLAIANLSQKIRQAYRAEEIDGETLRALTLASKQQQKEWLALFEDSEQGAPRGSNLKRWLLGGSQIPTTNAIFDLASYKGEIVSDLFGEESFFASPDTFWTLQNEAVAKLKTSFEAKGWTRVEVMEQDQRFHEWDYEKTSKKKGGAVFISVSDRGEVEAHEGYLSRAEARKLEAKSKGAPDKEAKPDKPELTKPMQNYFGLHRHAAVRLELLNHPQLALRLAVAHMIAGSRLWQVRPDPQRADKPEIEASVMQSKAQQAFAEKRQSVCDLLGLDPDRSELVRPNGDDYQTVAVFAQLFKLTDDEVMHTLAFAMAETLEAGTAVVEAVGVKTRTDMTNTWAPDDSFLALLAGKDVLHAMLSELGGPSVADANKGDTGKVQKGIIRDYIAGSNGRSQVQNWLPAYARFPAAAYTDRGGTGSGDSWKKVAALFESAST